jgi:hypothetical protein
MGKRPDTMTPFEEKAINDLALAMVDLDSDRTWIASQAESVAQLLGCTTAQLFAYLQPALCSIMSGPRVLDYWGQPMIDIQAAKASLQGWKLGAAVRPAL